MIHQLNLREYPNPVFVETGSFLGHGIQAALNNGFRRVISIELAEKYYRHCQHRFIGKHNVELLHGDSGELLPGVLAKLDTPATLWLDGHWSGNDTAHGPEPTPILRELACVRPIDTVLIDDVRCWSDEFDPAYNGGVRLAHIVNALGERGEFDITYVGDVLVAVPRATIGT